MRPDIRYYDKAEKEVDEVDGEDGMVDEQEAKPKDKSKVLQEIKIEYTKRRADENHFGPLSYAEVMDARSEEPWAVSDSVLNLV